MQPQTNDEDKFYLKYGVSPPTRESHGSTVDIEAALKEIQQSSNHEWRQQGPRLFCVRCPLEHGTEPRFKDFILVGTDKKGLPILKRIV